MDGFFTQLGQRKRKVEWLPIFIMRLCLGIFFILSGFFKLFDADQHDRLLKTLISAQVPYPGFNAYFIPIIEFLGGILILIGLLTTLASFVLFIVMVTAIVTDHIASAAFHGGFLLIENFFYLPEVLYALIFFWLFFSGPGKISLDYYLGQKRKRPLY